MFQVVTVYAEQRILAESFPSKREAREYARDIFADAPVEVVNEKTGALIGWVDSRGWHPPRRPELRPVEVA